MSFLTTTVILLGLVVFLGFFNEWVTQITNEIALMLFSILVGFVILLGAVLAGDATTPREVLEQYHLLDIERFLMEGVLCFMLFAGSCHMKLKNFKINARAISLLSLVATFLGALFYGILFYGVSRLLQLPLTLPICMMFGSIVAPTDPIAATSILKKFNLPSQIGFVIEGESLLNDGVGVALFVCFSGMVTAQSGGGFFSVMAKELFGAILTGLLVTAVCFPVFRRMRDEIRKIFVSLFAVALAYTICEKLGFSGAIASVVCGVLFSACRNYFEEKGEDMHLELFDHFWEILDTLLNSILYVMLGLTFVRILQMPMILLLSVLAIVLNLIGRSGSVAAASLLIGKLPDNYTRTAFVKLLTWGGLRGGLSIALAMSTSAMVSEDAYVIILGCTYAIVFFTTVIQGLSMPKVYAGISKGIK